MYPGEEAVFELADEERLIISMHQFAGYTSREIAAILHMNENTVRSKESRALKKWVSGYNKLLSVVNEVVKKGFSLQNGGAYVRKRNFR